MNLKKKLIFFKLFIIFTGKIQQQIFKYTVLKTEKNKDINKVSFIIEALMLIILFFTWTFNLYKTM